MFLKCNLKTTPPKYTQNQKIQQHLNNPTGEHYCLASYLALASFSQNLQVDSQNWKEISS